MTGRTVRVNTRSMRGLRTFHVSNYKSLQDVTVELGALNVLVGPNAAGKSNLLQAIAFLGDVARTDLLPALELHGGIEALFFRGSASQLRELTIAVKAAVTEHASGTALDEYTLTVQASKGVVGRVEQFSFKLRGGRGRRISVQGSKFEVSPAKGADGRSHSISKQSAALSTLPRLGEDAGGVQVQQMAELFTSFHVFDPNVVAARRPAALELQPRLRSDASNLASVLLSLSRAHPDAFALLVDDLRAIVPGVADLHFEPVGGTTDAVKITLEERNLRGRTDLAYASFGTVRALAILAMLHDPAPPKLRCVEEIDHGSHPHALDRLVDRLRASSANGQILLATHSPALVNRLRANELIVCERDPDTGASRIPAITTDDVNTLMEGEELGLGELWFSGALGGNP